MDSLKGLLSQLSRKKKGMMKRRRLGMKKGPESDAQKLFRSLYSGGGKNSPARLNKEMEGKSSKGTLTGRL